MPTISRATEPLPTLRCFPRAYPNLQVAQGNPMMLAGGPIRVVGNRELGERLGMASSWTGVVPPLAVVQPQSGRPLLWVEGRDRTILISETEEGLRLWFDPDAWAASLTAETLFIPNRPLWSYLPFHPQSVPTLVRLAGRRWMARATSPTSVQPADFLLDWLDRSIRALLVAPESPPSWTVVLSHDVDSATGLDGLERLLEVEERVGVRSCSFIVSGRFRLDDRFLTDIKQRGFEIGHHDHYHDYRTAYLPDAAIDARFRRARPFLERYDVEGFRAPGWYRTGRLLRITAQHFQYDSSFPSWRSIPKANGCLTRRPFLLEGLPIIPLTLPPDGELLALGLRASGILRVWREHVRFIRQRASASCIVHILTHPEPTFTSSKELINAYAEIIHELAQASDMRFRLPQEIARAVRESLSGNDQHHSAATPP